MGDNVHVVGAPAAPVDQRERQAAEDAGLLAAVATRWALGPGVRVHMLGPPALLREGCFCQGHAQRAGYLDWARLQEWEACEWFTWYRLYGGLPCFAGIQLMVAALYSTLQSSIVVTAFCTAA